MSAEGLCQTGQPPARSKSWVKVQREDQGAGLQVSTRGGFRCRLLHTLLEKIAGAQTGKEQQGKGNRQHTHTTAPTPLIIILQQKDTGQCRHTARKGHMWNRTHVRSRDTSIKQSDAGTHMSQTGTYMTQAATCMNQTGTYMKQKHTDKVDIDDTPR
ncbi:hypothetical protein NDU88_007459 [Pleurodeles waltl]|uniref:Uncharacterized protein n=1 Tax=Pleurodeles waltl TaxID=8319 RepID=A0AAV7SSU4_PLEWA|nr:hypothetical protein NDU88_007459 [Pleurodeles waltl]